MPIVTESRGYRNEEMSGTIENSLDRSQELISRKKKTVKIEPQNAIARTSENVQLNRIIELHTAELKLLQGMQLSLAAIQKGIIEERKHISNVLILVSTLRKLHIYIYIYI